MTVRAVLLAPRQYLRAANPEAREVDVWLPLEEVVEAAWQHGRELDAAVLAGPVQPITEGGALRVTNNATDWVFLTHPTCTVGMELRYRIRERIGEIAFTNVFKGDREVFLARATPPLVAVESRSYRFVRMPTLNTTSDKEAFSDADAAIVVDALEELIRWWCGVSIG